MLQEAPQTTVSTKPDWVSYFIQDPTTKQWVHTTLFKIPAGATVNVTVFGYDGCTPARNQFFGNVTGTIGNTETIDGKTVLAVDTWRTCSVGHTFSIPGIGQLLTQAVLNRDYPMVQGGLLITTALLVLVNIAVDVCYALLDPRVRYDGA